MRYTHMCGESIGARNSQAKSAVAFVGKKLDWLLWIKLLHTNAAILKTSWARPYCWVGVTSVWLNHYILGRASSQRRVRVQYPMILRCVSLAVGATGGSMAGHLWFLVLERGTFERPVSLVVPTRTGGLKIRMCLFLEFTEPTRINPTGCQGVISQTH